MADCTPKPASATAPTLLFFAFSFFLHVLGDTPPPFNPTDKIFLDCGSPGNSSDSRDNRLWVGDERSKFFPSDLHQNNASLTSQAETQSPSITGVPYTTARLSHSEFTYSFPLSPGQKFIRLYFYSAPYKDFHRSKAIFSVKTGLRTLLRDFNASVNADTSDPPSGAITREFCVYAEGNGVKLNLTFTPTNQDSYAFINGIEIVSMPDDLYYTPPNPNDHGGRGLKLVNMDKRLLPVENNTALELVYRMNMGGNLISPSQDTGMFRTWLQESNLLDSKLFAQPYDLSAAHLNYTKIFTYTAPENVYRTARTMGPNRTFNKGHSLTWEYPVDPGFTYMLRLHFCEFEDDITAAGDRVFLIYIRDYTAEPQFDVFRRAGGKYSPIYEDYAVLVPGGNQKKVNLSVTLQPNPEDFKTRYANVILNGIEIFKLNDSNGNLGGQNPDPPITTVIQSPPPSIPPKKNSGKTVAVVIPVVIVGVVAILALALFFFRRRRTFADQTSSDGASWLALYSTSTNKSNKSSKTRNSNLPSNLCRYFSLPEIQAATKNFDDNFIIGVGGFGNVYKGYIDNDATQVAIKRLKPGSKQGPHEFKTEIEMLSQLRHLHLVSLIGYCNDGKEMILVYDYMSHGTLRSHLYGDNEQPLTWNQRLQICIGAAKGLHYLHTGANQTIIHRDVKTTNILLDEKWVAKVSDFGLSKVGPANMSNAHISTVVKGSFGYLDPEYYRRQQLTEKSDVYSFGVVLCEVLCSRPPLIRSADKKQVYLAEWVRRCRRDNTVAQIIDPNLRNEITPECLRKFVEMAVSCIEDEGMKRPSMKDVVWGLEFALQLQEASKKKGEEDDVGGGERDVGEEQWLVDETLFSSTGDRRMESESGMSNYVTTSNSDVSIFTYNKGMSGTVFSEIKDPAGR
ncbi:receptor-like protein kinase FERONIA [Cucurbita moschata]|uniref:Receptor-like protein kinase FERONIA n=1 Tax=Cucurbita moschata TaxID=3662 RepID=A0A6J1GUC3_CUCMO|nr:receptor-like protein kinase FERONIA [Cucurbita moschata]